MITLKQFHDRCRELSENNEVWIEGVGDGRWKLVVERVEMGDNNETRETDA